MIARHSGPRGLCLSAALAAAILLFGTAATAAPCEDLFLPRALYGAGPYSLAVGTGDFDHDGIPDIVAANYQDASLSVLLGLGAGGVGSGVFAPEIRIAVGDGPRNVAVADFNEDGRPDLAVPLLDAGLTAVLLGRETGAATLFEDPVYLPTGPQSRAVLTGDFNEDAILDLAVSVSAGPALVVLLGNGSGGVADGTFATPVPYPTGAHPWGLAAGDYNGDGITDLAVAASSAGAVSVLYGGGSGGVGDGTFHAAVGFPVVGTPINLVSGDFTGDGILDLACTLNSGKVEVLKGGGAGGLPSGTFTSMGQLSVGAAPEGIVSADFNRDGIPDLATANITAGSVTVLIGLGAQSGGGFPFVRTSDLPAAPWAAGIAAADLDEDGVPDLVTSGARDDNVAVLLGACITPQTPPEPVLTSVRDVPRDQGGRVFVTWTASGLDAEPFREITSYRVWRRIPPAAAQGAAAARAGVEVMARSIPGSPETVYWEAIATLPAERLEGYGYVAPTLTDSTRNHNRYTAFFVSALTTDPFVFYPSNVDSGYSVDNIPPFRPGTAAAVYGDAGVTLHWVPDPAPDVAAHRIYRGTGMEFPLDDAHLVVATPDTGYVDEAGDRDDFYAISGVDVHGNEGEAVRIAPPGVTAVPPDPGRLLGIRAVLPNPATGTPAVSFALPSAAPATLELLDVTGRRAFARAVGALGPGFHQVTLHTDTPLAPGLYVVRLTQSGARVTAKLVVAR